MILISHRGNLTGPNTEMENKPEYIDAAIDADFDVEVDVWCPYDEDFYLGHDAPQYKVDDEFLMHRKDRLWIHCKDFSSFSLLATYYPDLNFFYHTNEDYVLTNKRYIWAYPGKSGDRNRTICVLPEQTNILTSDFAGICSDYIQTYTNKFTYEN